MMSYAPGGGAERVQSNPTSMPRVCLLTETFYPTVGGGETHARLLAARLNAMDVETFVLTRRSDGSLARKDSVDGVAIHRLPPAGMKRVGKFLMVPAVLRELSRRRSEYDAILVCGFRVLGVPAVIAARRLGKACVLRAEAEGEMSGGYASAYRKLPPVIGGIFNRWIEYRNRLLRQADGFVSISSRITREFEQAGVPQERIREITNGIDTRLFRVPGVVEKPVLRNRLGLPLDARLVIYSGKLNQGKGIEYLVQAWRTLAAVREDAHLVLMGSGAGQSLSREARIRAMVRDFGLGERVTFTGYVRNTHEYLQAADVFVLPSENEGLPMSMLEAMACGLPVVVTRVGGIPEAVRHLEDGYLVEPRDVQGLESALAHILDDQALSAHLGVNGRVAAERYSMENVAGQYRDLFRELSVGRRG